MTTPSYTDTLDRALRLLARARRVLDDQADEIQQGRALNRAHAGIAQDLAGEIVALIGHSVTDQPEAPEMFELREYLDELAEDLRMGTCPTCGHESAPSDIDRAVLLMRIVRTWQDRQTVAEQMFADALATERLRATAPFLTLADKLDDQNDAMWWSPLLAERIRACALDATP